MKKEQIVLKEAIQRLLKEHSMECSLLDNETPEAE
jgi:hypothetical protein